MNALIEATHLATPGSDASRIFHGRGGLYPGCEDWTLDWYSPVWVVTKFGESTEEEVQAIGDALALRWASIGNGQPLNWVFQRRKPDGPVSRPVTELMAGSVPEPHVVTENGAQYRVNVLAGQNRGLFLDMAEGRRWVRENARHGQVLNLFAYTCAFSVAALQGDAAEVINLDMASGPMATGRDNHRLNFAGTPLERRAKFLVHDLFKSWGKLKRMGPYDLIIMDPPSYQKGSFVANKDYARLVRRLPELLLPGGKALLCLNAPEIPESFLHDLLRTEAPTMVVEERLSNPPAFADVSNDRALKVIVATLPA
ncbi:class I SAM-dependent methyltransferase [Hydrogenophaga sp. 5NK40-0174]|uniref:class I SAM-dependent methyltransferase n=1 Tax=Hydrogenophaga sp. 5NK40-0174 TaxID=3127649 RepID=UPI003106DFD9